MKKTKLILILIIALFSYGNTNAQSHTFMPGWCKLAKSTGKSAKSESAIHQCQVCDAKDKKEKDAKLAEDTRRAKVISDKYKADKLASENARKAKQLEEAKNANSGDILINTQNKTNISINKEQSKIANNVTDKTIMIAAGGFGNILPYFENEKKERILENKDWTRTESIIGNSYTSDCINNLGIVRIGDPNFNWRLGTYYYNLVNSKGEYILNSTTISRIYHLNDGWFILKDFDNQNPYCLYNSNTRKKIILENFSIENTNTPLELYVPIYPKNIEKIPFNSKIEREISYSIGIKKKIIEKFQSQITEELLSKYSFALVHTSRIASKLNERYSDFELEKSDKVVLFCVTKNGELTTINLK